MVIISMGNRQNQRCGYSHDDVFLVKTFAVEEVVKVHGWMMRVVTVEGIGTLGLGVMLLQGVDVVIGPVRGLSKGC
jgi:hypothetical protein